MKGGNPLFIQWCNQFVDKILLEIEQIIEPSVNPMHKSSGRYTLQELYIQLYILRKKCNVFKTNLVKEWKKNDESKSQIFMSELDKIIAKINPFLQKIAQGDITIDNNDGIIRYINSDYKNDSAINELLKNNIDDQRDKITNALESRQKDRRRKNVLNNFNKTREAREAREAAAAADVDYDANLAALEALEAEAARPIKPLRPPVIPPIKPPRPPIIPPIKPPRPPVSAAIPPIKPQRPEVRQSAAIKISKLIRGRNTRKKIEAVRKAAAAETVAQKTIIKAAAANASRAASITAKTEQVLESERMTKDKIARIKLKREKVTIMTRKLFKIPTNISKTQSIRPFIKKYRKGILKANNPKKLESLINVFKTNDKGEPINDYKTDQLDKFIKDYNGLTFNDSIINPFIKPTSK